MSITQMIETGSVNPVWLFVFALVLGSLHGLEPGHSKTMMAAYIIAVQGTVKQAILLGVSAAFSHSIIVWVLAILALTLGNEMIGEELEPWFMIVSGVLVLGIAAWMLWQSLRPSGHDHHHDHGHNTGMITATLMSMDRVTAIGTPITMIAITTAIRMPMAPLVSPMSN